jgi:predicted acetylornithine/succinylornithine family transaminase
MEGDKKYLFQNYGDRLPVSFAKGSGAYLYDQEGKRYVDFFSGIAVTNLGHSHRKLSKVLHSQLDRIIHTSNWFYNAEQVEAAMLISGISFGGKTLFVNSGTEANEAAIKLARRHGIEKGISEPEILSFSNSFHGRTFGSMSATAQKKIQDGFGPLLPGFCYLHYNDAAGLEKELAGNRNLAAVMIELIQGEGGIVIAENEFVCLLSDICKKRDILLIVDEVQTGMGRTGKYFAYQHYGLEPDVITLAKGLGGGVPIGAMHSRDGLVGLLEKGRHGTTFGGNHLVCAAAASVIKEISGKGFMDRVNKTSARIFGRLEDLKKKSGIITDVRGLGLHIGIELNVQGMDYVKKALEMGLVINCTSEKVIRIMPPLNISDRAVKEGMDIFEEIITGEVKQN